MSVLLILMVLVFGMVESINGLSKRTAGKIEAFQAARAGFEAMTRSLSQATLNTYWDYYGTTSSGGARKFFAEWPAADRVSFAPSDYRRYSELHFISGSPKDLQIPNPRGNDLARPTHAVFFQAPLGYTLDPDLKGLSNVLNAVGFFIDYSDDSDGVPPFVQTDRATRKLPLNYRFRLKQVVQPSEKLMVYDTPTGKQWLIDAVATPQNVQTLATNIIACVILPRESSGDTAGTLAPGYRYDSRTPSADPQPAQQHQLPPLVQVTMAAIDEASALRLQSEQSDPKTPPDLLTKNGASLFINPANYPADLAALEQNLNDRRVNYRIFSTQVTIRSAKWSRPATP